MTKQQKKAVRKALRQYGRKLRAVGADMERMDALCDPWETVIWQVLDYYAQVDKTCAALLTLRYLYEQPEPEVVAGLHIGRTTYYHKELEMLSTAAVFAAKAGLI